MADQDLSHYAELIKAGIPYVDTNLQGIAELFAKLLDLMGSLNSVGKTGILSASGLNLKGIKIDVEGLLKGVRPICSVKEREFVDRILGFYSMKRMFEMYNNMMSAMQTMQEAGGFNFGDFGNSNDTDNVTGNFTGPNFESIFKSFSNLYSPGNSNTEEPPVSDYPFNNMDAVSAEIPNDTAADDSNKTVETPPEGNGSPMNNKMFDMLKTMIPPEQMSTFENLSMLFNNMSYDNNSITDDNKENNDG